MRFAKFHFRYSKSKRNGILMLVAIAFLLQAFIFWLKYNDGKVVRQPDLVAQQIQKELDSLASLNSEQELKIYPFNPNYLSDYKAYQLGLSVDEIDRLFTFRKKENYVNSAKQFQEVTKVSDSLLNAIKPYFKFPDWVAKQFPSKIRNFKSKAVKIVVKDINTATVNQLRKISGIGQKRAESIIKYRTLLGGFSLDVQVQEVWGIPQEVLEKLQKEFKVLSIPKIKKINVNKASVYQLSRVVYIDYKLANSIVEYRKEVAEIQNLAALKTVLNLSNHKFELISLYLQAY